MRVATVVTALLLALGANAQRDTVVVRTSAVNSVQTRASRVLTRASRWCL